MDKLDAMRVFYTVVDTGGFSKAAERLGISPSSVTAHVAALEAHFRVKLLNGTGLVARRRIDCVRRRPASGNEQQLAGRGAAFECGVRHGRVGQRMVGSGRQPQLP